MPSPLLTETEIAKALETLSGWSRRADGHALEKEFRFKNFREAFAFMTRVAAAAETLKHHPDWTNVYNRVSVALNTHESGGITALDVALARAMEAALKE